MNKRIWALILALAMVISIAPDLCLSASAAETSDTYTYDTYETEAPTNWSPMAWSNSGDSFVRTYTQTPLVDISVKNSAKAEFQWVFLGATSITDVSAQVRDDEASGYVYEIALNPDLCWEDGTPINADTYIYSMQQLLDPDMQYPQAKQFYTGVLAIAGAEAYALAGQTVIKDNGKTNVVTGEEDLVLGENGNYYDSNGLPLYIPLTTQMYWLYGTLQEYVKSYEAYFDVESYTKLEEMADSNGNVVLNDQTLALLKSVITLNGWEYSEDAFIYYIASSVTYPEANWETVGLTKVDEYTIRYTCVNPLHYFNFLSGMQNNNWLIHKELYESCKAAGTYGTTVDTTMSYGPYKLERVADNQIVLVRNENHFEYTADSNGRLSSITSFQVDGKAVPQWNMDAIVLNVNLGDDELRQSFLAGDLDYWAPKYTVIAEYAASPAFRQIENASTFSLFLNSDLATLQNMDANHGTTNAVVLSNESFRKAFSLAMDRSALAPVLGAYIPATILYGDSYYYDLEQNPASNFRKSEMAMQAVCDLYGVKYGSGTAYATLEEAYESITGYDPDAAKLLMAQACEELVAAGLYTEGEPIVFLYSGATAEPGASITAMLNETAGYLNEAAEGSGFGDISIGYINAGYAWTEAMRSGEATLVLGGWSASPSNPYELLELYLSPTYAYAPNNLDVDNESLTLNIAGKDYTMTWTQWYEMLAAGTGDFADAQQRAEALAELEAAYLGQYFVIPVCRSVTCHMLGYQVDYYTDDHNLMYGFGGLRLMRFNYTDAQWDAYVASGKLDYSAPAVETPETSGMCGENLTWELTDDGTLTISGSGAMYDYAVESAPWYDQRDQINNVVVSEGVTTIGEYAFYNLFNVGKTAVTPVSVSIHAVSGNGFHLPETLQTIGEGAFSGCSGVTVVEFPAAVESIGDDAFSGCTALKEIVFQGDAPEIGESAFEDVQAKVTYPEDNETWTEEVKENYGGDITWVPDESNLASGTWGDNISWTLGFDGTLIVCGEGEVAENRNEPYPWKTYADQIIKVIFEEGVTNVPVSAFEYSYPNLTSAELKSVEIIESTAFAQCTALTSIILPDTLTEIDNGAFSDAGLTTVDIPEGVTRIGLSAFSFSKLTEIVLPEGLQELGDSVFFGCEDLKSAYLPDTITTAGMGLFTNCTALETANIPKNLIYVPESMFSGCSSLKAIEIPEGITACYMDEFAGTALTTVTIPKSLTFLGCAFMNCTKLEEIIFQGDAPVIYDHGFEGVTATAYYPAGNETWTESVLQNYSGNITWVPYGEVEKDYTITWKQAYASLGGNIAVVFQADLSEDLAEDPNAFMRFTYAGKTVDIPVSEAARAGSYYNFFCRITSVNMTDDITAQMMVGEEAIGKSVTTSLEKYCSYIISTSQDAKTVNLMKAMLNYGAAAQKMMNYKTDNLANKSLSDADKVLTKVDATQYKHSITGTEDGIKPVEALLVLGSETTIRVGFSLTGNKTIEEYTFTVDGVEVRPEYKGGKYVLEVPDIAAHLLDEYHTFTCGDITITYCGLSYVNQVMSYYTEGTTFDMAAALYNYSQATEAFIA